MMVESEIEAANAPMAKVVSILLIIGQGIMVVGFILFLITAVIMGTDNNIKSDLLESASKELNSSVLFARCLAGAVVAVG